MGASATALAKRIAGPAQDPLDGGSTLELDELLSLPACHLAGLPLPVKIELQEAGIAHVIHWVSERCLGPTRGIVFDGDEVRALAIGVQAERLWPADFKGFCLRKLHDPSFRLTAQAALAGAQADDGLAWSLGRVLQWLELEPLAIELLQHGKLAAPPRRIGAAA